MHREGPYKLICSGLYGKTGILYMAVAKLIPPSPGIIWNGTSVITGPNNFTYTGFRASSFLHVFLIMILSGIKVRPETRGMHERVPYLVQGLCK